MARCVIHIGMHKTGSTSIQESLAGLADDKFVYPDFTGRANHTETLIPLFAKRPERVADRRIGFGKPPIGNDPGERFDEVVDRAMPHTLILSSEGIYTKINRNKLAKMKVYLERWFDEYVVIAYIRQPGSYLSSSFQNAVKSNHKSSFDMSHKQYRRHFEKFDDVFGRNNVRLFKFAPELFPERDVVRHFCAQVGVSLNPARIKRSNDSLSRELISVLYAWNRFVALTGATPADPRLEMVLRASFPREDGTPFRLSPRLTAAILDTPEAQADIAWMEERTGTSLAEDPTAVRPYDVTSEADLLTLTDTVVDRLGAISAEDPFKGKKRSRARLEAFLQSCIANAGQS